MLKKGSVTWLGEFKNKKAEEKFLDDESQLVWRKVRPIVLIMAFLNFLFIIPDLSLIKNSTTRFFISIDRTFLLLLVGVLWLKIPKLKGMQSYYRWITFCEILFAASFLVIYAVYENPDFLIQSWGVILLMLAYFFVPNRWVYTACITFFLYLGFFLVSFLIRPNVEIRELSAAMVYLLVIYLFAVITTWQMNYSRRIQYLYNKRISLYSQRDSLTRLYNRLKFDHELRKAISIANRYEAVFSLIFYDIDDFKQINDRNGHPMGDRILLHQARLIRRNMRDCDIYARWGGEEFVIILPNTGLEGALDVTRKIKELLAGHAFETGKITCSFGVTTFQANDDKQSIMKRVDRLLYLAKQTGKDRIMSDRDLRK